MEALRRLGSATAGHPPSRRRHGGHDAERRDRRRAHVVAAGDSYWEIAESLLAPGAAPGEVLDYTEALVAANAPRLGYADPNMLHPGDVLDLVAPPTATTARGGTPGPADPTPMPTSHRVQPATRTGRSQTGRWATRRRAG